MWKSFELAFTTHDKDTDHKTNVLRSYLKTPFQSAPALRGSPENMLIAKYPTNIVR